MVVKKVSKVNVDGRNGFQNSADYLRKGSELNFLGRDRNFGIWNGGTLVIGISILASL